VACAGAYASAWQFAAFWCLAGLRVGFDDSGGAGNAALTDSTVNFQEPGYVIYANQGMVLYNVTQGTSGPVTAVTTHTLTATGVTWDDGDAYRIIPLNGHEIATIDFYLGVAASDIHAALAATGQCDCTLAAWGGAYLEKLNVIEAAAFYQCTCARPNISDEMRQAYMQWATNELQNIRMGNIDLCQGATGREYPAVGWAEYSFTEGNWRRLIINRRLRES